MAERQKKPQRAKRAGTTRARSSAAVLGQQLTLERRVVDLLEVLHCLSAFAGFAAIDARADDREPALELVKVLDWLSALAANTSEPVQGLNAFLEAVSASHLLEEDSHG